MLVQTGWFVFTIKKKEKNGDFIPQVYKISFILEYMNKSVIFIYK